jgi:predicted MFS family arabinose efflux permease
MSAVTNGPVQMWCKSIVGFGRCYYQYANGKATYLVYALGLAGITCMLIPVFTTFWSLVMVYAVSVVPWTLVDPARKVLVSTFAEVNEVAKSFGISEMYYGIGATTGPIAGGYLYDLVSPQSPFYFNGILSMLVALFLFLLFSKERST